MSKRLLVVLAVVTALTSSLTSDAQKSNGLRVGIGIDGGSTLKDPTRAVIGIDGRVQIPLGNSFSAIGTTGYYQFFKTKTSNITIDGFGIVPVKVGLKYFPVKNVYVAGEVGAGFVTKGDDATSFVYSPSVGLAFANGFDISLKYEDYTKYNGYVSQLALRLAYGFKL